MNRYNEFMNSHFRSCRLIANARDNCRNRDVQLYALPGYWDVVGVTDGTDAWIAPASAGLFFGTATGDCAEIMRRLKAGEEPLPVPALRKPRVHLEEEPSEKPQARSRTRVRI